jgi:hypothetical protein
MALLLGAPSGYYEVDFRGAPITDTRLKDLAASLGRIRRLDLNLQGSPVTDEGLGCLGHLKNTLRLRLGNTRVTGEGVEALRRDLPAAAVYQSRSISACFQSRSSRL